MENGHPRSNTNGLSAARSRGIDGRLRDAYRSMFVVANAPRDFFRPVEWFGALWCGREGMQRTLDGYVCVGAPSPSMRQDNRHMQRPQQSAYPRTPTQTRPTTSLPSPSLSFALALSRDPHSMECFKSFLFVSSIDPWKVRPRHRAGPKHDGSGLLLVEAGPRHRHSTAASPSPSK